MTLNYAHIRIFSVSGGSTLTWVAETDKYESCIFKRSRSGIGEFTITLNGRAPKASEFREGRLIWIKPVKSRVGIITSVFKSGSGNSVKWTVKGCEAKGKTRDRVIQYTGMSNYVLDDDAETVIKTAIDRFFGSTAESNRQLPLINIPASDGFGATYLLSERFTNLATALESCSSATGQWWRFEINTDTKKLDVLATPPTDRTWATGTVKAPFSEKFQTVGGVDYTKDVADYRNVAIVAGQGEDTARTVATVGSVTGWDRREEFYDARDLSDSGSLTKRGQAKLAEVEDVEGVDITALTKSQLVCDEDYFVGDIVSVSAYGVTTDLPITEVSESWGYDGYGIDITFGKPVASRLDAVKELRSSVQNSLSI